MADDDTERVIFTIVNPRPVSGPIMPSSSARKAWPNADRVSGSDSFRVRRFIGSSCGPGARSRLPSGCEGIGVSETAAQPTAPAVRFAASGKTLLHPLAGHTGPAATSNKMERTGPAHETPLIATIASGLVLGFGFGLAANRLRISPLIGYLLAGILVGPFTPGFVADQALANQLAEVGVILLLFAVGLHFSLADLMSVRATALPGAIGQLTISTLLGMALARGFGWQTDAGLLFGLPSPAARAPRGRLAHRPGSRNGRRAGGRLAGAGRQLVVFDETETMTAAAQRDGARW